MSDLAHSDSRSIYDISVPLREDFPVWPGDPPVTVERFLSRANGDATNASCVSCSVHSGTHVDAPRHFFSEGPGVDDLALSVMVGPAYVASVEGVVQITADLLTTLQLPEGVERLILKTDNSRLWKEQPTTFQRGYVALTHDAADWVVERGIKLIGIDYHSIQRFDDTVPYTHERLLGAGVVIVETLNLTGVAPGLYLLACLPVNITGADGAPARAILLST